MPRIDGRAPDELREIKITRGFIDSAWGSALVEFGQTRILCTAMVEDKVPPFLVNSGRGWLSAEYGMLPGSTGTRKTRDGRRGGHVDGRTVEIQRLIGRSLRTIVNTDIIGQRTIWLDCDVIQADGGTRTTSITGAWIALYDCFAKMRERRVIKKEKDPIHTGISAVSVGIVDGQPLLDLCYEEDSRAEGDFNFVLTHDGDIIEVQASAEQRPISADLYGACFELAREGCKKIASAQNMSLIAELP